jgi:hypothetical protein
MVLWNNVFIDNEYGTDIYSYLYMEAVWYVDAQCKSSRSDIDFTDRCTSGGRKHGPEDMCLWVEGCKTSTRAACSHEPPCMLTNAGS